ncbi:MAG: PKD domain-containing protein [Paludibacteraceae bacterium]|nr:PKD domain-containing protein [Paludibacteraceae bacterium]
MLCLLMAACKEKEVIFTYSPETPRAGQTITFTNSTAEGEKWEWNFGDGTTSAAKSPSKVYKRPGTYSVVLTVDGKKSHRLAKTLTVVDSIPQITLVNDSIVHFLTPVKLQMSAYDPYRYEKLYLWLLSEDVELVEGELTDEYITVVFKYHDVAIPVNCLFTLGDDVYECEAAFYVQDTTAVALYMHTTDRIYCQRTFVYGEEVPVVCANVWDQSQIPDYAVYYALNANNGLRYRGQLYHTEEHSIYRGANIWTDVTHIGYGLSAGQDITGLAWYNDICMIAYGNGIYRFRESDIDKGVTPEAGAILTDVAVLDFAVDSVARKIYYLTTTGLNVCNINGDNARLLTAKTDGNALCVDNTMNRIYWTAEDGVWFLPLVQSSNNATTDSPEQLNNIHAASLASDPTPRYCLVPHY